LRRCAKVPKIFGTCAKESKTWGWKIHSWTGSLGGFQALTVNVVVINSEIIAGKSAVDSGAADRKV